jgi:hypothetical protein
MKMITLCSRCHDVYYPELKCQGKVCPFPNPPGLILKPT